MAMPEPKKPFANRLEYNVWAYEVSDKVACFTECNKPTRTCGLLRNHFFMGEKVGYLNLARISENEHTVIMGPDHDLFVGKTEAEIAKIREEEQDKQELQWPPT